MVCKIFLALVIEFTLSCFLFRIELAKTLGDNQEVLQGVPKITETCRIYIFKKLFYYNINRPYAKKVGTYTYMMFVPPYVISILPLPDVRPTLYDINSPLHISL